MTNVRIRKYSWQLAPEHVRAIRQQVFIEEQGVPPELEWDATDEIADHFLAILPGNVPAGVARLFSGLDQTAHIGRMAILPEHRGKGVGKVLLRHIMKEATGQFREIRLSAQEHAIPFYRKAGFHVCSDVYDDAGIPHHDMRCLAPALAADTESGHENPLILGHDPQVWQFSDQETMLTLMDSLAGQARQRLWLYDQLLEHELYSRDRFRELLLALARRHRMSEIRLLIHDDKPLVRRRHQLVELMRRIPTKISLKLIDENSALEEQPFLLVDREGALLRRDFARRQGFAGFCEAGRVRRLAENYQRMWDVARPSLELRELSL